MLNARQRKFVTEYFKSGNAYQAAIKAGYSENYANNGINKLLGNDGIKKALKRLSDKVESQKIADGAEVMKYLTSVMRGEQRETVIVPTPTGLGKAEKEPDQRTRIQAAREILKRYPAGTPEELETMQILRAVQVTKAQAEAQLAEIRAQLAKYEVALRREEFEGTDDEARVDDLQSAVKQGLKEVFGDEDGVEK